MTFKWHLSDKESDNLNVYVDPCLFWSRLDEVKKLFGHYVQTIGKRVYDEVPVPNLNDFRNSPFMKKLRLGLFAESYSESNEHCNETEKKCLRIFKTVFKKLCTSKVMYLNYTLVVTLQNPGKGQTLDPNSLQVCPMFRFAKKSSKDCPSTNLFIGEDEKLYSSFQDFIKNNEIAHNRLFFIMKNGCFSSLDIDGEPATHPRIL